MKRFGYFLLVNSFLIWGLVFLLPFTGMSTSDMAGYAVVLYMISYALFFAGGVLVGKDAVSGLKRTFRSWYKSKKSSAEVATDEASPES